MAIFDKLKSIFSSPSGIIKEDIKRLSKHGGELSSKASEYITNGSHNLS
ncbi:MAG: hypothetical protein ACJAUP_003817 [Cellvibrionaceae bacterium]|jgi:hypothetical protein